jgi:hypothetical protein
MALDHTAISSAAERLEAMDALYRFGAGVDDNDPGLLATAFSEDAVVDFGPCGRAMDLDFATLTGHETIVGFLSRTAEKQTISHVIANTRVRIDGRSAVLRTLVDATHLPRNDHSRRCRMMNWYDVDLVKHADEWRMRRVVISNVWFCGDVQVLLGR